MSFYGTIGEVRETGSSGDGISFQWSIPGFVFREGEKGDYFKSLPFDGCGARWKFRIHPIGLLQDSSSDGVSIVLMRSHFGPPLNLRVTLGIRVAEGVQNRRGGSREFTSKDHERSWNTFCWRWELEDEKSGLLQGDTLVLKIDMKTEGTSFAKDTSTQTEESERDEIATGDNRSSGKKDTFTQMEESEEYEVATGTNETLEKRGFEEWQKSLLKLLESGKESDVVIKVKNKEFRAHRILLQARSAVFEAMFDYDMVEKQSGVVTMEDCDPDTFPDFLKYVYTGCTGVISSRNVFHLYSVSDKYDMNSLKEQCADFMRKNLAVASFGETISLAVKYDEKELIDLTTEFFCANTLDIVKTVEWQKFLAENPTVGNELFILSYSHKK